MVKVDVPVAAAVVRVLVVVAALAPAKTKSTNFHVTKKTDCSVFFVTCVTSFLSSTQIRKHNAKEPE